MNDTNDINVDYIGLPEDLSDKDDKKYIKAYCKCEVPITMGICIPRKPNRSEYSFYCPLCGTIGKVIS